MVTDKQCLNPHQRAHGGGADAKWTRRHLTHQGAHSGGVIGSETSETTTTRNVTFVRMRSELVVTSRTKEHTVVE